MHMTRKRPQPQRPRAPVQATHRQSLGGLLPADRYATRSSFVRGSVAVAAAPTGLPLPAACVPCCPRCCCARLSACNGVLGALMPPDLAHTGLPPGAPPPPPRENCIAGGGLPVAFGVGGFAAVQLPAGMSMLSGGDGVQPSSLRLDYPQLRTDRSNQTGQVAGMSARVICAGGPLAIRYQGGNGGHAERNDFHFAWTDPHRSLHTQMHLPPTPVEM